jgi:hypothetical protein
MTRSASLSPLGPEFDAFLFAPIGEDRNGMRLSVLSALARLDVDPWQQAGELAQLPRETATQKLASLIASLPDGPSGHPDAGTIAVRLIALLPRRAGPAAPAQETLFGIGVVNGPRGFLYAAVIFVAFVLGAQWITASRQPPGLVDNPSGPATSAFSPQMPSPTEAH